MLEYTYYILFGMLTVMAILMIVSPIPKEDHRLYGYRLSRWILAASYIALALYTMVKCQIPLELMHPMFLFMSNTQACLLALSHLNLISPQRVTARYVIAHFMPMIICLAIYIVIRCTCPHVALTSYDSIVNNIREPELWIRMIWMGEYVGICFYFIVRFVRETERWKIMALDFFADEDMINVKLIRRSFSVVVAIGVTTWAITSSLIPTISTILNMMILCMYIVMGCLFLQYPTLFVKMKPVLYEPATEQEKESGSQKQWSILREKIIGQRYYAEKGVTMEQMAHNLGVSRTALSNNLNREEEMNFNSFVNRLRIEEAQRIMRQDPNKTLHDVAECVGYTEPSNFCREFKRWSGKTPCEWKKAERI